MNATIRVFGHYDRRSRTPLVHEETLPAASYGQAWELAETALRAHSGKSAHVTVDGPNQNFNSRWFSR